MSDSTPATAATGWCREHDEAEPCPLCEARRNVNSVIDRHPTKPGGHSLCGTYPCTECA